MRIISDLDIVEFGERQKLAKETSRYVRYIN